MDSKVNPWSFTVQIPSTVAHVVAILSTIFRLLYRWHLSKFWWDDGWATATLICDTLCLASVWMQKDPQNLDTPPAINGRGKWLLSLTITSTVWLARMSILASVVRIASPIQTLRRIAYGTGIMFMAMQAGLIAQKIDICMVNLCRFTSPVAIAQLVTDVVSDATLVALPMWFLRDVKLPQDRRILILSAFSASILITGITILHSTLLFQQYATNTTLIIGQVKAAFALLVCNSLVLATFIYRMCHVSGGGADCAMPGVDAEVRSSSVELTSIIDLPSKTSSCIHAVHGAENSICADHDVHID